MGFTKTRALRWVRNSVLLPLLLLFTVVLLRVVYIGCTQEGHELTAEDVGETISVGASEFTLLNITGNEAELSGPYAGGDVLEG